MDGTREDNAEARRKHYHDNMLQTLAETLEVLNAETTEAKLEGHCRPFEIPDQPIEQNEMLNEEIIREWTRTQSIREDEVRGSPRRVDFSFPTYEPEERLPFQRVVVEGEDASGVSLYVIY